MRKIRDNTPQKCTKCDRTFYCTTVCPYCHTDIDTGETVNVKLKKKNATIIQGMLMAVLTMGLLLIISQCTKDNGNKKIDGTCMRCNKEGVYEIGGDRYCEKHYLEVMGELIAWDED